MNFKVELHKYMYHMDSHFTYNTMRICVCVCVYVYMWIRMYTYIIIRSHERRVNRSSSHSHTSRVLRDARAQPALRRNGDWRRRLFLTVVVGQSHDCLSNIHLRPRGFVLPPAHLPSGCQLISSVTDFPPQAGDNVLAQGCSCCRRHGSVTRRWPA